MVKKVEDFMGDEFKSTMELIKQMMADIKTSIDILSTKLDTSINALSDTKASVSVLESELANIKTGHNTCQTIITDMQRKIITMEGKIAQYDSDKKFYLEKFDDLYKRFVDDNERLVALEDYKKANEVVEKKSNNWKYWIWIIIGWLVSTAMGVLSLVLK